MVGSRIVPSTFALSLSLVLSFPLCAEDTRSKSGDSWSETGWPLVQQYCIDCHNEDTQEGELDLSNYRTLGQLEESGGSMQRVLEMVRFGAMPPDDVERPSEPERKRLVAALDRAMFAVSCDLRPRPGKVTARRLNRAEYNHTVRDLFGMDLRPADAFPSDEVGAGFDNNGDVLSLSPMQVEKYLAAAEQVADAVLIDPESLPKINEDRPSDQLLVSGDAQTGRFNGRFLHVDAFAWADFEVPVSGEYRVRVRGGASDRGEKGTIAVFDGEGLLRGKAELKYYGGSGSSQRSEFKLKLDAGPVRLIVEPIEGDRKLEVGKTRSEKFARLDPKLIEEAAKRQKQPLKPNRRIDESKFPFMIRTISVEGPRKHPDDAFPPSQHRILRRYARFDGNKWHEVEKSATESLRPLMRRAFRGPVSDEEVKPYAALVTAATERGESYYRGMQIAISAVLVSPRFLFRVETPPEDATPEADGSMRLTQHQLATRLSHFLWSSTPDERLLEDADKGRLKGKAIEQHVRRMIEDPKSEALGSQLAAQWFGLRNLDSHEADTDQFDAFTPSLREAMSQETELLFMHMVRGNRPVAELLTADFSFLNQELAAHYGLDVDGGKQFQRVSLKQTPRRGILSHASFLTLSSNPARTSPVKRGKWILENILGTPPPEPPAGVPELEETPAANAGASLREQMEIHRTDPTCAACHRVMDELGFGLEQYDAIGRFRASEGKHPIDASGELPGGRTFDGARELSDLLSKTESKALARTTVEKVMTFALGRELTPSDRCVVDEIVVHAAEQEYRLLDLILEVVNSRPFQYYEWQPPQSSPTPSA